MIEAIRDVATVLETAGPYGLVAFLAWAYWHVTQRKDADLKSVSKQFVELIKAQTEALVRSEHALERLEQAVMQLAEKLPKSVPPPKDGE